MADAAVKPAPAPTSAVAADAAVVRGASPDINTTYRDPELDVMRWQLRFENESREIFAQRKPIVAAIGLRPGQAIADVGAGTGLFLPLFSRAVGPTGKVYAVDIAPRFLEHLRARVKREKLPNVTVVQGKSASIELPAGAVDVVFMSDTYHHFEKPMASLASIHKALRPGGALVIIDFERIPGKTRKWIVEHVRAGKQTVRKELEAAGFRFVAELKVGLRENYAMRFTKQ